MFSFIEKMFNSDSSTDDCSEDSYGVGEYPGDLPGYDRNIIQLDIEERITRTVPNIFYAVLLYLVTITTLNGKNVD